MTVESVVTLNLPRVALQSETLEDFWKLLDERLEVVHEALIFRKERVFDARPKMLQFCINMVHLEKD